jgi:hypothetical protein
MNRKPKCDLFDAQIVPDAPTVQPVVRPLRNAAIIVPGAIFRKISTKELWIYEGGRKFALSRADGGFSLVSMHESALDPALYDYLGTVSEFPKIHFNVPLKQSEWMALRQQCLHPDPRESSYLICTHILHGKPLDVCAWCDEAAFSLWLTAVRDVNLVL